MNDWTDTVMPRGKYAGKTVEEVPSSYLKWVTENWDDEQVVCACESEWNYRERYDEHWEEEESGDEWATNSFGRA